MKRRYFLAALGSALTALGAGCTSNEDSAGTEESTSVITTEGTDSKTTNSTSVANEETTESATPTESAGPPFERRRATGAELTVQENISVGAQDSVVEYDQEAETVTTKLDEEGDRTRTRPLDDYLDNVVGHSRAAIPVCDRYDAVVTEYTEPSMGRTCGTSRTDGQNIIEGTVYESDDEAFETDVVTALPETVHVTLSIEEIQTDYTFEYPVYVEITPEWQQE